MGILDAPAVSQRKFRLQQFLSNWGYHGLRPLFPTMSSPPTITRGNTGTSIQNSSYLNGATTLNAASSVFRFLGAIWQDYTAGGGFPAKRPIHIAGGGKTAPLRVRFQTDAPSFDICFLDSGFSQLSLIIDGEIVSRNKYVTFGNTGNYRYYNINFGANSVTCEKAQTNFAITSGGSGYAVGDVIILNGGSEDAEGDPCTVMVTQVTGISVNGVDIKYPGRYTSQPTGTFSQASTTGAGTGFTATAQFFGQVQTNRKMRKIEIVYQSPAVFMGVVHNPNLDTVIPWVDDEAHVPRLCVIGDSIQIGTYLRYAGAHIGAQVAQRLGLWSGLAINGIGGTGWITPNTAGVLGSSAWAHPSRVADFVAHQADIYLIIGSQNDGADSALLRSSVTSVIDQLHAAVPGCVVVGIGNVLGYSASLCAGIEAGFLAAADQSRTRFVNNHSPTPWLPSISAGQWTVTGDGNHLSQSGQDRFAAIAAPHVAAAIVDMLRG